MFTRKDFMAVANIIKQIENPAHRTNMWAEFEALFENNPRFNGSLFATACGVIVKKKAKK